MATFALVDCNNFYASCERLFQPRLRGRPVVVLSNNDGCVIARSNEAKALGVGMGAPLFKIRNLVEEHNIAVCSNHSNSQPPCPQQYDFAAKTALLPS